MSLSDKSVYKWDISIVAHSNCTERLKRKSFGNMRRKVLKQTKARRGRISLYRRKPLGTPIFLRAGPGRVLSARSGLLSCAIALPSFPCACLLESSSLLCASHFLFLTSFIFCCLSLSALNVLQLCMRLLALLWPGLSALARSGAWLELGM